MSSDDSQGQSRSDQEAAELLLMEADAFLEFFDRLRLAVAIIRGFDQLDADIALTADELSALNLSNVEGRSLKRAAGHVGHISDFLEKLYHDYFDRLILPPPVSVTRARDQFYNLGIMLQSYLRMDPEDLRGLIGYVRKREPSVIPLLVPQETAPPAGEVLSLSSEVAPAHSGKPTVFIGHGHSDLFWRVINFLEKRLNVTPLFLKLRSGRDGTTWPSSRTSLTKRTSRLSWQRPMTRTVAGNCWLDRTSCMRLDCSKDD
jgi:hypothetical protein